MRGYTGDPGHQGPFLGHLESLGWVSNFTSLTDSSLQQKCTSPREATASVFSLENTLKSSFSLRGRTPLHTTTHTYTRPRPCPHLEATRRIGPQLSHLERNTQLSTSSLLRAQAPTHPTGISTERHGLERVGAGSPMTAVIPVKR